MHKRVIIVEKILEYAATFRMEDATRIEEKLFENSNSAISGIFLNGGCTRRS